MSMDYGSLHRHNIAYILSYTAICDSDDHRDARRLMPYFGTCGLGQVAQAQYYNMHVHEKIRR